MSAPEPVAAAASFFGAPVFSFRLSSLPSVPFFLLSGEVGEVGEVGDVTELPFSSSVAGAWERDSESSGALVPNTFSAAFQNCFSLASSSFVSVSGRPGAIDLEVDIVGVKKMACEGVFRERQECRREKSEFESFATAYADIRSATGSR